MASAADVARTQSFDVGPATGPACLLLHGLTGSTAELRYLGEKLAEAGFHVRAPLLPGHGLNAPDLTTAGSDDWQLAARTALDAIAEPAHLVGLSMGALLAMHLAAVAPAKVRSLALLAPAVRLSGLGRAVAALLYRVPLIPKIVPTLPWSTASDMRDPALAGTNPKNGRLALHALAELRRLEDRTFEDAHKVEAPVLMVLGARDRTISNHGAEKLIGPLNAEVFVAERSGHQVGLDYDRDGVAEAVIRHLRTSDAASPDQSVTAGKRREAGG